MTSPPKQIEVECPACGTVYTDWYRPSINLALDDFDEDYLRRASTATCPECSHTVDLDTLTVRPDWEFEFGPAHSEEGETD